MTPNWRIFCTYFEACVIYSVTGMKILFALILKWIGGGLDFGVLGRVPYAENFLLKNGVLGSIPYADKRQNCIMPYLLYDVSEIVICLGIRMNKLRCWKYIGAKLIYCWMWMKLLFCLGIRMNKLQCWKYIGAKLIYCWMRVKILFILSCMWISFDVVYIYILERSLFTVEWEWNFYLFGIVC